MHAKYTPCTHALADKKEIRQSWPEKSCKKQRLYLDLRCGINSIFTVEHNNERVKTVYSNCTVNSAHLQYEHPNITLPEHSRVEQLEKGTTAKQHLSNEHALEQTNCATSD